MAGRIRFGTDGWRAIIADEFTFGNVALCAQGIASYLLKEGIANRGLVVGYDTRFASREFAGRVAEVMAGNGIRAYLASSPAPTPAVSYSILQHSAAGACVITASHNPAAWNGLKYKPSYAGSASPEVIARLEDEIGEAEGKGVSTLPLEEAQGSGLVQSMDPAPAYLEQMGRLVDLELVRRSGLNVIVDSMYGAGAGYLAQLLGHDGAGDGATRVQEIHGEVNPAFPGIRQPEPIAANLTHLSQTVLEQNASVGIALDGDADRLGVVDESGVCLSTLQAFALIAYYLLEQKGQRGALIRSLTSTTMIDKLGERYGVPVIETPVGFKDIGTAMLREDALMGGEESGGYGFRGHIPERDGVLSGLLFLEYMAKTGLSPSQLLQQLYQMVGEHHYQRRDVTFPTERRAQIQAKLEGAELTHLGGVPIESTDSVDGRRFVLAGGAWLAVRFSGTEPLLRIYGEAGSPGLVKDMLDDAGAYLGV
ncbi:MAG: phosphoglucomutase/phosphomannomutase family protein [Dehalococcoidia bacterium]|nr:phosphoglucomutase/phosphomannomutase family protein [Dehalococcoidia bacterium]